MKDLDSLDKQLISILRSNARTSVVELSKKLKVSRATVQNRMARLEKDEIICGYTVTLKPGTDINPVKAYTSINTEGRHEHRIISRLRGNPNIIKLHSTNGRWDLIAEISTDTLASFNNVLNEIRLIEGIVSTETNLLTETYKF